MPIQYFANRVARAQVPAIDRVLARRKILTATGSANTASNALSAVISSNVDWQVDNVQLSFSNSATRTFSISIKNGRQIVAGLNDYFCVLVDGFAYEGITLSPGFYSGAELAAEMKIQLDANTNFAAAALTFTVAYDATTGVFTITPSTGTIKYIALNATTFRWNADSTAGCVIGFTNNSSTFESSVVSDTNVYGLNTTIALATQTASTASTYVRDTVDTLSMDQAILISSNVGADVTVNYIVMYESIV